MGSELLLLLSLVAAGITLRDDPIVGDTVTYLDGKWTATATDNHKVCAYKSNTDYKAGPGGGDGQMVPGIMSSAACCDICKQDSLCVAAVWCASGSGCDNNCYRKAAADIAGGSYDREARVACAIQPGVPQTPPAPIPANVPGDLLTDLQTANLIPDPLFETTFQNSSLWHDYVWTYSTQFTVKSTTGPKFIVFDGIKMGASISVNGKLVGVANDQFLRFIFPLTGLAIKNNVTVTFDPTIDVKGRFMACTGGWDWAPYSTTFSGQPHTFSKGIWKSVYVVETTAAVLTDVVSQIFYKGPYPTNPLQAGTHGDFEVQAKVHLWAASEINGRVAVQGEWGDSTQMDVKLASGDNVFTLQLTATANQISLWWPAGMGQTKLYNLTVTFTGASSPALVANRRVGFRYFALVTGNDTDPSYVQRAAGEQGTDSQGMYFRVNGALVWSRGANMIPMEELEGRMLAEAHARLVQSAVDGNMNTLRVWGGGIFLPQIFYDTCDALGIMVYHDMQYAQEGHAPDNNTIQEQELRHNIRRLANHPSIMLWDGCNECQVVIDTPTGIYATFVMTIVAEEDRSRAIWPSCPALGWTQGVRKLDCLPTGDPLLTPKNGKEIETHGPYQHGGGFPTVNGDSGPAPFDPNLPINVTPSAIGPMYDNVFASEFGSSVWSSFESLSSQMSPARWSLEGGQPPDTCTEGFDKVCTGGNVMAQRNYPCHNIIETYFGPQPSFNVSGETQFKKQLWQCMVGQALVIKQDIETRRSKNEFGLIVWQFNEIWPTGGWGSVEYGTPVKGQVLGGRWKPLQYWYKSSLLAEVMATCGAGGQCYVKNDGSFPFAGKLQLNTVTFATGAVSPLLTRELNMPAGAGVTEFFTLAQPVDGTKQILTAVITSSSGSEVSRNVIPFAIPAKMQLPKATVTFLVAAQPNPDESIDIKLTTDQIAVWVTLTTLAHGRFSDNALLMTPGTQIVRFIPFVALDVNLLKSSLRVEHLAGYQ